MLSVVAPRALRGCAFASWTRCSLSLIPATVWWPMCQLVCGAFTDPCDLINGSSNSVSHLRTQTLKHTHTHTHTLNTHTHTSHLTHTHTLFNPHTHFKTRTHTLKHTHTHWHTQTRTHTHTHTHTHRHTHTHTDTHCIVLSTLGTQACDTPNRCARNCPSPLR